ncbi:MAG: dTDP-glucose 4,6-dehydratase [bacterium]
MDNVLITGGAGFIGSNFVRLISERHPSWNLTIIDALTYAGNLDNFPEGFWDAPNREFVHANILDEDVVDKLVSKSEAIVHLAAETHVDRSILDAGKFIDTDVKGTWVLLEAAKRHKVKRFVHVSTDEVYGEAEGKPSLEGDDLKPKSPYAASKAAADRLAYSYYATHKLPVVITRCSNNYGANQYPEKLIPLFVTNALEDKPLPIYGSGENTRDWINVLDHCDALEILLLDIGHHGEVYNVSSGEEHSVLEITDIILEKLGKSHDLIQHVRDREGHVVRHAVDSTKFKETFNWMPFSGFKRSMEETIQWYVDNEEWWRKVKQKSEDYKEWIDKQYSDR